MIRTGYRRRDRCRHRLLLAGSERRPAATAAGGPAAVDFSKVEIKTTDLGDNVYMLEGEGGNITVAVAKDGIIMVDGQYAPLHDKIKAAIAAISNLPIKYLINTHYHGDHTGGNEAFAKDGVDDRCADQCQEAACGRHHQWPDRRQDAAGAARRAAGRNLHGLFQDQASRPRRRPQTHRQRPYRRRHLCLVQDRQCAGDRRHLHQRPLSQHRLRQWRQHQRHDRGGRRLSQAHQCQEPDRAGPRPGRRQGGADGIPRPCWSPRATAMAQAGQGRQERRRCGRGQTVRRSRQEMGADRARQHRISSAWSTTRSPTEPEKKPLLKRILRRS